MTWSIVSTVERRGLHLHVHGLVEVAIGELADRRRHRRREEQRLTARRRLLEDPLDVLHEAEREHLIGLVEHDIAAIRELQPAAADQVHHAAGRADHDLRALAQLHRLLGDRLTAEDGDDAHALELREGAQRLRNLDAELARGREHQHLDVFRGLVDLLDGRQPEGRGLAAAGLRLADDVAAAHDHRDGLDLDRHGLAVVERLDRFEHALREAEFGESGHCLPPWFTYRHGGAAGPAGSAVAPHGACTAERGAHSPGQRVAPGTGTL